MSWGEVTCQFHGNCKHDSTPAKCNPYCNNYLLRNDLLDRKTPFPPKIIMMSNPTHEEDVFKQKFLGGKS